MNYHDVILEEQEVEGNAMFTGVQVVATKNFAETFGDGWEILAFIAIHKIVHTYENPGKLQVFRYKGKKFWVIADFERGDKLSDYDGLEYFYVTCLMPEDY